MKYLLSFALLTSLFSCSNLSKNMVKKGDFSIKNGVYKNHSWRSSLEFKRVSWYHELTMLYDFMYAEIDEKNDFYHWFSEDEKRRVEHCEDLIVSLNYSLDSERLSHAMLNTQLRDNGYEQYAAPNFSRTLKVHPDFEQLSLALYKVNIFCRKKSLKDPVFINFPNFHEIKL